MNTWQKYLAAVVGAPVLVCALAITVFAETSQQTGIGGKQVYTYDPATGFARGESLSGGIETRSTTVMSGVTTDTTAPAVTIPMGPKSFYGQVVCSSGACTQTQAIYGDIDDDETNGVLLCTITLSATPADYDACPVVTANFAYYYVTTTNTTGTAATGAIYAMY